MSSVCVLSDARDTLTLQLGDDLCLRAIRKLRGLRWSRQHLFHLQPENTGGQRPGEPGTLRAQRIPVLLSISG